MCCSFFLSLKKQYAPSNWSMETYFHLFKTEKLDWNIVRIPFDQLCAENRFYVQALKNRKKYLKPNPGFFVCINSYVKIFIKILVKLFRKLVKYVPIDNLIAARKIINNRLYFSLLPFRVWNHLFQCCRNQYEGNMSLFVTKLYLSNSKICKFIEKKLIINAVELFTVHLHYGIINNGNVNLFVHSCICNRQKLENLNFGTLYYEAISSPFILWKFYLDILGIIVLNNCDKSTEAIL